MITKSIQVLQTIKFQKEKTLYSCIAAICVDSVLKLGGKSYPQVFLEQCKYRLNKKKPVNFIDAELEDSIDAESDFEKLSDEKSEIDTK